MPKPIAHSDVPFWLAYLPRLVIPLLNTNEARAIKSAIEDALEKQSKGIHPAESLKRAFYKIRQRSPDAFCKFTCDAIRALHGSQDNHGLFIFFKNNTLPNLLLLSQGTPLSKVMALDNGRPKNENWKFNALEDAATLYVFYSQNIKMERKASSYLKSVIIEAFSNSPLIYDIDRNSLDRAIRKMSGVKLDGNNYFLISGILSKYHTSMRRLCIPLRPVDRTPEIALDSKLKAGARNRGWGVFVSNF